MLIPAPGRDPRSSVDEPGPPDDWSDERNLHPDPVRRALDEVPQGAVAFRVLGDPEPKGSMRAVGRGAYPSVVDANRELPAWSRAVALEAEQAARHLGGPLTGPLGVDVTFRLRMPPSRSVKLHKAAGEYGVPHWHMPDLDKLFRAVGDALQSGGLIVNDGQIAAIATRKDETSTGWTGCRVVVRQLAPTVPRRDP